MNYLNLDTSILHSPEIIGADPVQRSTWFMVLLWSAQQENGGCIAGAAEWKDRRWQQTCGVTAKEISNCAPLLSLAGADVLVWAYPKDAEAKIKAKRTAGQLGGQSKSQAKTQAARGNGWNGGRPETQAKTQAKTQAETQATTEAEPKQEPNERERKGKEGKEKEEEGERSSVFSGQASPPPPPPPETFSAWKARLQAMKPGVSIDAELGKAARKRKITTGTDTVPRTWFESHWWPHVDALEDLAELASETRAKAPAIPEPTFPGWRAVIVANFQTNSIHELDDWNALSPTAQQVYSAYLKKHAQNS